MTRAGQRESQLQKRGPPMQNAERKRKEMAPPVIDYEAPRIELIVSEEGMKREVHYAGGVNSIGDR